MALSILQRFNEAASLPNICVYLANFSGPIIAIHWALSIDVLVVAVVA